MERIGLTCDTRVSQSLSLSLSLCLSVCLALSFRFSPSPRCIDPSVDGFALQTLPSDKKTSKRKTKKVKQTAGHPPTSQPGNGEPTSQKNFCSNRRRANETTTCLAKKTHSTDSTFVPKGEPTDCDRVFYLQTHGECRETTSLSSCASLKTSFRIGPRARRRSRAPTAVQRPKVRRWVGCCSPQSSLVGWWWNQACVCGMFRC